jgi:hypothetical protein
MLKLRKPIIVAGLALIAIAVLWAVSLAALRSFYPYGHRVGCMPNTMGALLYYAREHEGRFPEAQSSSAVDALRVFYPDYLGEELAGITGNRSEVLRRLKKHERLDERVSSWVYQPGLRLDDDARLALIWERTGGVTVNGRRTPGHVVGFVDGEVRQIDDSNWTAFLEEQKDLRDKLPQKRKSQQQSASPREP